MRYYKYGWDWFVGCYIIADASTNILSGREPCSKSHSSRLDIVTSGGYLGAFLVQLPNQSLGGTAEPPSTAQFSGLVLGVAQELVQTWREAVPPSPVMAAVSLRLLKKLRMRASAEVLHKLGCASTRGRAADHWAKHHTSEVRNLDDRPCAEPVRAALLMTPRSDNLE